MMTLEQLVAQLRAAYGDGLHAVVLYGSAVTGEHVQKRSDYNVLVVADDLPPERLDAASAVMHGWRDGKNPPPMVFTLQEWQSSSDAFPMEYADILSRHKVLYGDARLFDGIAVTRDTLRIQVEREALSGVFRVRQGRLLAGTDARRQMDLLTGTLSALMIVFRGVLRLHGKTPPTGYIDIVRDVAGCTGLDPTPYFDVIHHVHGERAMPEKDAARVLAAYLKGMEALVAHVDGLPSTRTPA